MEFKTNTHCAEIDSDINSKFIKITKKHFVQDDLNAIKMVVIADKMLHTYLSDYNLYEFDSFWKEKIEKHYSEGEQCVILHYILIHATQNIEMRRLMNCYNHIKNYLKNKEIHPAFMLMITKHVVRIPQNVGVAQLKAWLELREMVLSEVSLNKYILDETFLFVIGDEEVKEHLRSRYLGKMKSEPVTEKPEICRLILKKQKNGAPLESFKSFVCQVIRLFKNYYIKPIDRFGRKVTLGSLVSHVGNYLGVDLKNFSQLHQETKYLDWLVNVNKWIQDSIATSK
jgi:hypothetical protein